MRGEDDPAVELVDERLLEDMVGWGALRKANSFATEKQKNMMII